MQTKTGPGQLWAVETRGQGSLAAAGHSTAGGCAAKTGGDMEHPHCTAGPTEFYTESLVEQMPSTWPDQGDQLEGDLGLSIHQCPWY